MKYTKPCAVMLFMALTGCAVGPDYQTPPLPPEAGYEAAPAGPDADAQTFVPAQDVPERWWELFQSPPLNDLVRQAVAGNPDVQAATAALKASEELLRAQVGAYYPTIGGGISGTRQLTPQGSLSSTAASTSPIYNLYTAQVTVSYMPDIWGLNARTVEALRAQSEIQRFQMEAAYQTLAANLVVTVITEASLRGQIQAAGQIIALEQDALQVMQRQLDLGQIAQVDVLAQETAVAQAQQALPPLEKQLAQVRDLLAVLLGRFPNQQPAQQFSLENLQLPHDIPVSLPVRLVEQRPDVRAAAAALHASTALVGVAVANRLPNITLDGAFGATAPFLLGAQGLGGKDMQFWSMAGNWSAVLFDGFSLQHKQRAAEFGLEQAAAQYRSTVLAAVQNVADTLHALRQDAEGLKAAVRAEQAASATLAVTRRQLELGAIPYLALINAQQAALQAKITLVQARAMRLADMVALYQALGGGWWNRPAAAAE